STTITSTFKPVCLKPSICCSINVPEAGASADGYMLVTARMRREGRFISDLRTDVVSNASARCQLDRQKHDGPLVKSLSRYTRRRVIITKGFYNGAVGFRTEEFG